MRYRLCVVLGMLSFASPAGAQDRAQQWARCLNEQEAFTADQSIEGCTAVIQAARDVPANMAIAFNSRGNSHAAKDQPDRAIEDYDQAIRLNPNYAAPHHNRGGVYLDRAQYDRAIQDFDQALRLKPNEAVLLSGRCYAKASAGALAAALADCNEALRRMPGHAEFLDSRGFTYLKMRQLPQALADYDAAFKVDPGRRPPCSDAASCAARWAMCRAATPTSPPPSRSMPRLPGGWRAAASFRERSPSTSEPDAPKPLAGQSDNGHTAPGGGVAGSRPASPWRTRCLS
jgi:tetratricopeptide (TPR) repeat protein